MVRDAEAHAAEDRRRREEAEIRNEASSVLYTTEKTLKESGDRIPAALRSQVETALADLRSVSENGTASQVKSAVSRVQEAARNMGEALYQGAGGAGSRPSDASGGTGADGSPGAKSGGQGSSVTGGWTRGTRTARSSRRGAGRSRAGGRLSGEVSLRDS